ncbi:MULTISPECIES: TauD/TfdA family dioxygenase [unclassified Variovorax]|mgnify:CR=1 FL=1|jgi:taurine dioxygenase|uniref:TauD/TfdA dioxygenase family protein n=1 Tax=unclassified Variovorax TaxID=663243 RepID=UPI000F7DA769|nr:MULTISPECIES: TauD/TfdA family dioxygenase [unclassified Variovorax]RSZ39932.1 TauD/TfdA family dioxygenase [Variovorax sp. 553]RSZ40362.1 TauD/TfdA family dioxygenase [Variovorax sp. 679]
MRDVATVAKEEPVQVVPLSGGLGAELRGMFIRSEMSSEEVDFVYEMLLKHRVLFFRNQHQITDQSHRDFAQNFGEIVSHPTVATQDEPTILELHSHRGGRANSWHTDVTFDLRPPKLSILRAVTLPDLGGDTVWANTVAAYEHLPDNLKALAEELWAVHGNDFDYAASRVELLHDDTAKKYRRQYAAQVIKSEHPVVHVHPDTGEKSLLLGHYAQRFVGCNTYDSDRLYEILQAHVTRLENTVRWHWAPGDVAMWDNRSTQHYAINDYGDRTRVMRRVTIVGDVPTASDGAKSRPHEQ